MCRFLRLNKRICGCRYRNLDFAKRFHTITHCNLNVYILPNSVFVSFTYFLPPFSFHSFPSVSDGISFFVFINSREAYTHHSRRLHTTAATRRRRASRRARTTRTTTRAAASSTSTITRRSLCPSTCDIRNDVLSWTSELRALAPDSYISYRLTTTYPRNNLRYFCSQLGLVTSSAQPCLAGWLFWLLMV